jgi:HK97 family phage prohead protease
VTAKTAEASTVHEPLGKPGGPGLFHHKGLQLPAYIQHVAHRLLAQGHDESKAIEMAVGIVKNWAAGHDGHGNKVHPDVQAAAARAVAEWEKAKTTGRSAVTASERAEMTAASINDLPDSAFAYIQPGGTKDSSGRTVPRSLRHFPVHDAAHARNALARAPQSPFGKQAMPKILAACKKFGIDVAGQESGDSGRAADDGPQPFHRSFPLEDCSIRAGGDGRTVDAYAAVFETPVPIHDGDGDYIEVIDPAAFTRILPKLAPQGSRATWRVGVFYNHGMTIHGTASDRNSLPIGIPLEIKADARGLFTRTRYHRGELADQVLEAIREGSLAGYSFSGRFDRSAPPRPRGGWHPDYAGTLPVVRRTESTLREYGPTPFPAYADAGITAVRADLVAVQLGQVTEALRSGVPLDSLQPGDSAAPSDWGSAAGDSHPVVRSARSTKEEMNAARAAFLQRHRR